MVLAANDEFFAPKENLLEPGPPLWAEGRFTDRGKWMDGWETRRRRDGGHDWCVLRLGLPGLVRGVVVDTAYFRANFPEACSIEGCALDGYPAAEDVTGPEVAWVPVLERVPLAGDSRNEFAVDCPYRLTHLRFRIYPDGGVARLRVHGEALVDPRRLGPDGEVDLAAAEHGGLVTGVSDRFFAPPENLIAPGRAADMGGGWETRRRGPDRDWVSLRLAATGTIRRVEVDTSHYKGNYPESCVLEARGAAGTGPAGWREVLPRTPLRPHQRHLFDVEPAEGVAEVRFSIYPDGGVARLRVLGTVDQGGWEALKLRHLNALLPERAAAELLRCCGSTEWARSMAARRPFAGPEALRAAAEAVWSGLGRDDVLEAFAAHPRIGERAATPGAGTAAGGTAAWSAREQAATATANEATLAALTEANRIYEARFGHRFIVFASGKGTGEMLALLRGRLDSEPEAELATAAEEQRKIMILRLEKLLRE